MVDDLRCRAVADPRTAWPRPALGHDQAVSRRAVAMGPAGNHLRMPADLSRTATVPGDEVPGEPVQPEPSGPEPPGPEPLEPPPIPPPVPPPPHPVPPPVPPPEPQPEPPAPPPEPGRSRGRCRRRNRSRSPYRGPSRTRNRCRRRLRVTLRCPAAHLARVLRRRADRARPAFCPGGHRHPGVTAGARRASASILGMEGFPPRDVAGARAVAGARL